MKIMNTMKAYKLLIALFIVVFASCEVLDVDPSDKIPADDALGNKKGINAALIGAYDQLQSASFSQDVILFGDLAADNLIHVGTKKEYRQISDQLIVAENSYVGGIWNSAYDGINRCNNILANIAAVEDMTEDEKNQVIAQTKFLRALNYFTLVKFFGGVPLKNAPTQGISPEELNVARSSEAAIYQFVLDELNQAETLIGDANSGETILANAAAIVALRARVNLYAGNFNDAATDALAVIDMDYELEAGDYFDYIFVEEENSPEIIFQVDFTNDDDVNGLADWCMPESRFEVAAWEDDDKTASIYDAYNENDYRREYGMGGDAETDYFCAKYTRFNDDNDNTIVLRLGEMYLIAAEALNEVAYVADGTAFDLLNEIRSRAGISTYNSTNLPDQQAFREAIELERRLELAFEGHRFFDLRRTGRGAVVLNKPGKLITTNEMYFPIPQSEIDANEAINENNTGY